MKMHVPTVRHGAVRGNGVFSGRNVQFGLTHPEKPAYSRMIMENQKGFARHRSWQIRQPSLCSSCPRKHGISWINSNKIDFCPWNRGFWWTGCKTTGILHWAEHPSLSGICAGAAVEGFAPCSRTSLTLPRGPCNKEGKKLKLRFYMYIGPLESKLSRPYIHIKTGWLSSSGLLCCGEWGIKVQFCIVLTPFHM